MNYHSLRKPSSRSGFALVIVLSVLVLLVALAMGFLSRASTERSAASGYYASVSARQLADTAVGLVQGQINMATTQGSNVAWTSQPGMVRTFDTSGQIIKAYKLYSGPEMVSSKVSITSGKSSDEAPEGWVGNTATWVDLNSPIESGGIKNFPILEPTAVAEGFTINKVPGATEYQPVPMPVRWLYVLQNGTLVDAKGEGTSGVVEGETAANPIVGRVAFWTDDETCKVNINTAGVGTYWDVPRAYTSQEVDLGKYQPAQKEFQRYPGHPAMTCLSSIFPSMTPTQIYALAPRIVGGGSNEGTVQPTAALTPDSDRLYSSVDELIFNASRSSNASLTKVQLEQAKFFLTAHSRAPETNLFNLPRIACWPIFKDLVADRITAFDKLIAFCASTGSSKDLKQYYFQRELANSPTNDISILRNTNLYKYLQYVTANSIPGFGGNFLTKYGSDRNQILTEIFDYIRSANLHDDVLAPNKQFTPYWNSVSAYGFPTGHGWVAPTRYQPAGSGMTLGFGRNFTLSEMGIAFICNAVADNVATPLVDESFGSNTLTNPALGAGVLIPGEKCIQAVMIPEFFSPMCGYTNLCPDILVEITGLDTFTVTTSNTAAETSTVSLFPGLSPVSTPYSKINPAYDNARDWGGNPGWRFSFYGMGIPARGTVPSDVIGTSEILNAPLSARVQNFYNFIGVPARVKANSSGGTMQFSGGDIVVKFYAKSTVAATPANLLQTFNITFPPGTFNMPEIPTATLQQIPGGISSPPLRQWTFRAGVLAANTTGRLYAFGKQFGGFNAPGSGAGQPGAGALFIKEYDIIQTVLPAHGDFRLMAATPVVPNTVFKPHTRYGNLTYRFANDLSSPVTNTDPQYVGGKYISTLTYGSKWIPDIPATATGANTPEITGDFDNSIGPAMDGPMINKPDEGATWRSGATTPYFDASGLSNTGGPALFSPNRQMPSPGMLGSLPTGVVADIPWRTLLFRPQASHFGATSPKDHLILDLFWMPVVEPYAISDRFSTAGKINMNYQILPFTYLERSTGMRALLKSEKIIAIPNARANTYKGSGAPGTYRKDLNYTETLNQFKTKFDSGDIYKSASEICDVHMVPSDKNLADMATYWNNTAAANALTGDNSRERIYTTLYSRLTTRSNTFTVHFRVQALKKRKESAPGVWTEGKDVVTGEYRGSTTLERFIDANNTEIPDYADPTTNLTSVKTLDKFYKWRVVQNRQFAP